MRKATYRQTKIFGLLLLVITLLNYSDKLSFISLTAANPNTLVSEIENNAVYFIKSASNYNKGWDVRSGDYNNNNDVLLYDSHHYGNQRFVLSKADEQCYYILPVETNLKYLAIKSGSNSENAKLVIRSEEYSTSSVNANKFKLQYNPSTSSFRISTGASNFTKFLTLKNSNTNNGNEIVHKNPTSTGFNYYYEWKLVKTDNLSINCMNSVSVGPYSSMFFNVKVPRTLTYIIEARTTAISIMNLYIHDGNVPVAESSTNNNGFQSIYCALNENIDYYLWFSNNSSLSLNFEIALFPEKEVYFSSYYEPNDINTTTDITNHYSNFLIKGYFLNHINNGHKSSLLETINANGVLSILNDYYMISSHGSENGYTWVSPTSYFYHNELPDMSNVKVAVWATCYGGKAGNIADVSVRNKNAEASIGWPGLSFVDTSRVFTNHFWPKILNGQSVESAYSQALSEAKNSWWYLLTILGGDSLADLRLYKNSGRGEIILPTEYLVINYENMQFVDEKINYDKYKLYQYYGNYKRYVKFLDGLITNDYYIEDLSTNKIYKSKHNVDENTIYKGENPIVVSKDIKILNSMHLFAKDNDLLRKLNIKQIEKSNGNLKSYYYDIEDVYTKEQLSFEYVQELFN